MGKPRRSKRHTLPTGRVQARQSEQPAKPVCAWFAYRSRRLTVTQKVTFGGYRIDPIKADKYQSGFACLLCPLVAVIVVLKAGADALNHQPHGLARDGRKAFDAQRPARFCSIAHPL